MDSLKKIIKQISEDKNVLAIVQFGSTVKKTNRPMPDIDLAVVLFDPKRNICKYLFI